MRISDWSSDVCSSDLGVIAPQRDAADAAARDLLPLAAVRRRQDGLGRALQGDDAIGLDHRVERESGTGLALAPAAMTAMDEQGAAGHAVTHGAAGAAAIDGQVDGATHGSNCLLAIVGKDYAAGDAS